ncbi:HtaA domain-containing protein [Amycolatopsis thailandensis]|uniref:HtaA domain-containing protein n=1 Tax=Amycolatopsis thailandensis TaxID=589330 RepID=UPI00378B0800
MSLRRWGAALAGAALVAGIAVTPALAADPFTPKVTVTPSTGLDPAGTKIVVKGTGFDPAANDGKGFGLRVGPAKPDVRDRAGKDFQVSRLIKKGAVGTQIPLGDDGNWEYAVTVKAEYVASGTTYSAKTQPFSVFVFGWDTPVLTWDSTTPVKFTGIGDPDPGPGDTAAGLGWGVRQSWRSYITRGGTVTPSNGATLDSSAPNVEPFPYRWKYGSSTWDSGTGAVSYAGQVTYTFEAHTIWDFTIADPRIAIAGDGTGKLTAKIGYSFYGTKTAPQKVRTPSDVVFADLKLKAPQQVGDGVVVDIESAKLTKEGAEAFAGFYKEGDALDTGRIAFPGKSGPAPTSSQPTSSAPTSSVPTSSVPTSTPASTTSSACVLTPDSAKQGNLLWGFKQSFRRYVATGSGTSITASDGVEVTDIDKIDGTGPPSGAYRWGFDSVRYQSASEFTTQFRGKVTFAYPSHSFELSIGRPKVVVAQGKGTLYADVELKTTSGAPSPPINQPGVELASLDLAAAKTTEGAGVLSVAGIKVTLGNAEAFAKFYTVGEVLDEAAVTLGASCANLPGGSGPGSGPGAGSGSGSDDLVPDVKYRPDSALASTGVESGVWLLGGLVLLGAGLLLVLVVRRRTA